MSTRTRRCVWARPRVPCLEAEGGGSRAWVPTGRRLGHRGVAGNWLLARPSFMLHFLTASLSPGNRHQSFGTRNEITAATSYSSNTDGSSLPARQDRIRDNVARWFVTLCFAGQVKVFRASGMIWLWDMLGRDEAVERSGLPRMGKLWIIPPQADLHLVVLGGTAPVASRVDTLGCEEGKPGLVQRLRLVPSGAN